MQLTRESHGKDREGLTSLSACVIMNYKKDKEGWHKQFRMMSQKRKQVGSLAQIQEIGTVGEPFNYRLHDIIKTEETDQETVDGIISRVYAPGLLYQGQVIKKAQESRSDWAKRPSHLLKFPLRS